MDVEDLSNQLMDAVIKGKGDDAMRLTQELVEKSTASDILDSMTKAMTIVGDYFEQKKYYLPHVLLSASAFEKGFEIVKPLLLESASMNGGKSVKAVIGVCEGDVHDIGKKIMGALLRASSFDVEDLGRDVPNEVFVEKVQNEGIELVAMSALMTVSAREMKNVIDMMNEASIREKCKVMVGGGSVTEKYSSTIGADGYGLDAPAGVEKARSLFNLDQ